MDYPVSDILNREHLKIALVTVAVVARLLFAGILNISVALQNILLLSISHIISKQPVTAISLKQHH